MSTVNASMTVIGAGSYGTALAITLARNGHDVVLWGHDPKHIATLQRDRCNVAFLPDVPFPDSLHLESDLATALAASRNILIVVPSHVFGDVLRQIKPLMRRMRALSGRLKDWKPKPDACCRTLPVKRWVMRSRWRSSPARPLPKSWPLACRRRFRWPQPIGPSQTIFNSCCTAARASASTATPILSACSWAER